MLVVQDAGPALTIGDRARCDKTAQVELLIDKVGFDSREEGREGDGTPPPQVGVPEEDNSSVEGAIAGAFEDSGERVCLACARPENRTQRCNYAQQTRAPV